MKIRNIFTFIINSRGYYIKIKEKIENNFKNANKNTKEELNKTLFNYKNGN